MCKSNVCLCFALLMISISYVFAESATPSKESEITYDSKHRLSCGGYALKGWVPELDGDTEFYKPDTDTLVCTMSMGSGKCADGKRCKCPPPEWDENGCWTTYGKLRQKRFENSRHFKESQSTKPSPEAIPPS